MLLYSHYSLYICYCILFINVSFSKTISIYNSGTQYLFRRYRITLFVFSAQINSRNSGMFAFEFRLNTNKQDAFGYQNIKMSNYRMASISQCLLWIYYCNLPDFCHGFCPLQMEHMVYKKFIYQTDKLWQPKLEFSSVALLPPGNVKWLKWLKLECNN